MFKLVVLSLNSCFFAKTKNNINKFSFKTAFPKLFMIILRSKFFSFYNKKDYLQQHIEKRREGTWQRSLKLKIVQQ